MGSKMAAPKASTPATATPAATPAPAPIKPGESVLAPKLKPSETAAINDKPPVSTAGTPAELSVRMFECAKANDLAGVRALLDAGADGKYTFHEDGTWGASKDDNPLRYAITHENLEMAALLLTRGASTAAKYGETDWRGCGSRQSVFDLACSAKNAEFLSLFLAHGADPNVTNTSSTHSMRTDGSSSTALLHTVIQQRNVPKIQILLKAGANPNAVWNERYHNERGYNRTTKLPALAIAINTRTSAPSAEDAKRDPKLQAAYLDACHVRNVMINELLHHSADPNAPFVQTSYVDNPAAKIAAADPKYDDDPRGGMYVSPVVVVLTSGNVFHLGVNARDVELVWLMLLYGADVNAKVKVVSDDTSVKPNKEYTTLEIIDRPFTAAGGDEEDESADSKSKKPKAVSASEAVLIANLKALIADPPSFTTIRARFTAMNKDGTAYFLPELIDIILGYVAAPPIVVKSAIPPKAATVDSYDDE